MRSVAIPLAVLAILVPLVSATCNIDSASLKTLSTSDSLVVTRAGIVATFRLGCSSGTPEPKLHAEDDTGKYLAVSVSNQNKEWRQASFVEDLTESRSRWLEINVYDDETYTKLVAARRSGADISYYKPLKTISHKHGGVTGGPLFKTETVAAIGLIATFFYAHLFRSKIVN